MRYLTFLLLAVLVSCDSNGQGSRGFVKDTRTENVQNIEEVEKQVSSFTFKVDSVEENLSRLPKVSYTEFAENRNSKFEVIPHENDSVTSIRPSFQNMLHVAYSEHRPIILSPEDFWLLIAKNASIQINHNIDSLRPLIFKFEEKQQLIIRNNSLGEKTPLAWAELIDSFAVNSQDFTTENAFKFFDTEFSTTDVNGKVALQSILMESFKQGIDYIGESGCGFPEITIEGTSEDWQSIINKLGFLDEIGMSDYRESITPLLKEIKNSSSGKPNKLFWKDFYKDHVSYGEHWVNGWITKFYYFIERYPRKVVHESGIVIRKKLEGDREFKKGYFKNNFYLSKDSTLSRIYNSEFFSMKTSCPITWNYYQGKRIITKKLELIGGHMACIQKDNGALQSLISWRIQEQGVRKTEKEYSFFYHPKLSDEQTRERPEEIQTLDFSSPNN